MRKKASKSRTRSKVKVKDLAPKDIKAVKGGVEGSLLHTEQRRGGLLDVQRNAEAMIGTRSEGLEDQQLQRGLWVSLVAHRTHIVG